MLGGQAGAGCGTWKRSRSGKVERLPDFYSGSAQREARRCITAPAPAAAMAIRAGAIPARVVEDVNRNWLSVAAAREDLRRRRTRRAERRRLSWSMKTAHAELRSRGSKSRLQSPTAKNGHGSGPRRAARNNRETNHEQKLSYARTGIGWLVRGAARRRHRPQAEDPIIIGAAIAQSGVVAPYDDGPAKAMEIAIEEINAKGGLLGRQLKIIYSDTKSDIAYGATAAQDVIDKGAQMVVVTCDYDYRQCGRIGRRLRQPDRLLDLRRRSEVRARPASAPMPSPWRPARRARRWRWPNGPTT